MYTYKEQPVRLNRTICSERLLRWPKILLILHPYKFIFLILHPYKFSFSGSDRPTQWDHVTPIFCGNFEDFGFLAALYPPSSLPHCTD